MSEEQVAEVSQEVAQSVEAAPVSDWRDSIPEEIRGHNSLRHISDVGALAKSYVHAQSMIGADKVAIPGKHATEEDWNEVYQKLGRPESADKYELEMRNLPEGVESDEQTLEWFKNTAFKAGLTPSQAQTLMDEYNAMTGETVSMSGADIEMRVEEAERVLRQEYGNAFEDRLSLGSAVLDEFGAEDISELQLADGTLLGDNPDVVRFLVNVGRFMNERIGEDTLAGAKTSGALDPSEAKAKLDELMAPNSPYWDPRHPERSWYVNEALKYREMMNGGS
jgi:hypothetical protein